MDIVKTIKVTLLLVQEDLDRVNNLLLAINATDIDLPDEERQEYTIEDLARGAFWSALDQLEAKYDLENRIGKLRRKHQQLGALLALAKEGGTP